MSRLKAPVFPMIRELLSYDGERFVQCAYYIILGRKPDKEGISVYLKCLLAGMSKIRIITILARSPEAKSSGVHTVDLEVSLKIQAILSSRVLSRMLRSLWNKFSTPAIPDFFDPVLYMQEYPDVAKAHIPPYFHYVNWGMEEGRCPGFDSDWYQSEYPDVVATGYDPRSHHDKYGRAQKCHPCFAANWYLKENPDVVTAGLGAYAHYDQYGRKEGRQPAYSPHADYRKWVTQFDTLSTEMRASMYAQCALFTRKPLVSIVMAVCNTSPERLREALKSVSNQIYRNWELCVAYDSETDSVSRSILERLATEDHRVKIKSCETNGRISKTKTAALELVTGEWIALLEPDDVLAESALFWVVDATNSFPDIAMIYSDEDKINGLGVRTGPHFNCDWNPDLFYSQNMVPHLGVYRSGLVRQANGFRDDFDGSEDYDLLLRCTEVIGADQIHHIPRVLYRRRALDGQTRIGGTAKSSTGLAGISALNEHLERTGANAIAESAPHGCRIRYRLPTDPPLISLIIPTRNGLRLLQTCVESIIDRTTYKPFEVLIVDNGSDDPETLHYLRNIIAKKGFRVIRDDRPFNYSALNNAAVKLASGEIIGLINNDIEVITPDWLTEMASHALRPEVAAVGARLWYPNDTLQHGGIFLAGGQAWHAHRYIAKNDPGYMARASHVQSFSAVTGACLVVRRSVYQELGGLNEADLSITFNDVDFCIRALKAGYRNIWTPYAELYHHESATRGEDDTPRKSGHARQELSFMQARWARELIRDPAYSPNLTNDYEDFSLAWPPRVDNVGGSS
jgi:glycosyltransferase involved in cell wall biosynthesis